MAASICRRARRDSQRMSAGQHGGWWYPGHVMQARTTRHGLQRMPARIAMFMLAAALFVITLARGASAYTPPPIAGYVTDTAHKLSPAEVQAFDEKLAIYRKCSGNHVVVFMTDSLAGDTVEDVGYATFNGWRIGDGKKETGVLLVIAPNERKVRIETGKGAGGALTDLESNRILREHVSANLKKDQFWGAIDEGTTEIERALLRDARPDAATCVVTPATRPAPVASAPLIARPSPITPVQPDAPHAEESRVRPILTFLGFGLSILVVALPGKRPSLSFSGCVGAFLTIGGSLFVALVVGIVGSVVGGTMLGTTAILVIALCLVPLAIIGRVLYAYRDRRSGQSAAGSDYSGGSSYDSSTSGSSGSSSFDTSSSTSSFGSGGSSSDSSSSGSSGIDTSYTGGSGSSGGGGSSDSY